MLALHRGQAMGFPAGRPGEALTGRLHTLLDAVDAQAIASGSTHLIRRALADQPRAEEQLITGLRGLYTALGENPAPQREARALLDYFSEEQLARLLVISISSIQRYVRGERRPPDVVTDRLHWLAVAIGYLTGTYNEHGVRRWFDRPRTALGGQSPTQALLFQDDWTPDTEAAQRVEQLARTLSGMPAT